LYFSVKKRLCTKNPLFHRLLVQSHDYYLNLFLYLKKIETSIKPRLTHTVHVSLLEDEPSHIHIKSYEVMPEILEIKVRLDETWAEIVATGEAILIRAVPGFDSEKWKAVNR
jgi:hypothetical protein